VSVTATINSVSFAGTPTVFCGQSDDIARIAIWRTVKVAALRCHQVQ